MGRPGGRREEAEERGGDGDDLLLILRLHGGWNQTGRGGAVDN